MKNINWSKLFWAMKETLCIMLVGIIGVGLFILPTLVAIVSNNPAWFALYGVGFFILTAWEKYHGR